MPGVTTRRGLLQAGAGTLLVARGAAGATLVAAAAPVPTDARADVVHRGRTVAVTRRGRTVAVAHAARASLVLVDRRSQRRRTVALAGQPLELAVSPDDRLLAVTTAFWDHPGVDLVGVRDGARRAHLAAGSAPFAPAFTPDGHHLLITGGEGEGTLRILRGPAFEQGRTVALGRGARGVAAGDDVAWVALHGEDVVVRVDLRSGRVTRRIAVPALPERLALSAGGRTLLVAHGGHDVHDVSEVDTRSGRVRRRPVGGAVSAVAWGPRGLRLAAVHLDDAIVAIDARGRRRRLATVAGPRGLAVAGRHAFTTSSASGAIGRVRL